MTAPNPTFTIVITRPGTADWDRREFSGEVVIGRTDDCDVVLADATVSRRHAVIRRDGDRFLIEDLESRNGTLIDGRRCQGGPVAAGAGANVRIGPFQLSLDVVEGAPDATTVLAAQAINSRCFLDAGLRAFYVDGVVAMEGIAGREFALLERLVQAAPNLVPNRELADYIWGEGQWDVYMLHNLVRRVRRKIEETTTVEAIVTIPGAGYRVI
jgi:DNA-binding response OmpR family regulator